MPKIGHKNFEIAKCRVPGFIAVATGPEDSFSYLYYGSHSFMLNLEDVNASLIAKMKKEKVTTRLDSLLFRFDYLEPSVTDWSAEFGLPYHINLILDDVQFKEAFNLACGSSFSNSIKGQKDKKKDDSSEVVLVQRKMDSTSR